jgi:phenylalanyl-tRNA synthetase beta chain
MKVSFDILKKFVTPPREFSGRELADALTMSTVEVDDYTDQAKSLAGAVVGLVIKVSPHPKADKLKLATVDIGKKEIEVVCGGVNLHEGMKVAFATIGTRVRWHGQGDWVTLAKATIRGVESCGMACAAEELELQDDKAVEGGIMDLTYLEVPPGTPLAHALGLNDIILDIDNKSITHRPDLWGHFGLARELSAMWQVPLYEPKAPRIKPEIDVPLMVSVKKPVHVGRYLAVSVGHLKVAPSPKWLQSALLSLGMRPINNIVDVTNYVMLELGQPLHAFDLDKLVSPEIVIRQAKKGEKFTTLDGVERELDESMLMIADKKHAQAIAGVMGGQTSEVSNSTKTIALESATFEAVNIRTTAAKLGLRTEASARFEKALDPNLAELALRRAIELFKEICPGAKVLSPLVDVYNNPRSAQPIELPLSWLFARLGVELPQEEVKNILERLGFKVERTVKTDGGTPYRAAEGGSGTGEDDEKFLVTPPSWRATRDITIPEDLVEEVARIYGYGKIPLALPKFPIEPSERDLAQDLRWKIRDILIGADFIETLSYSFISEKLITDLADEVYEAADINTSSLVELLNPVDKIQKYLRPALLPNVLEQFVKNILLLPHDNLKVFEIGRVFFGAEGDWSSGGKNTSSFLPSQPYHLVLCQRLAVGDVVNSFRLLKGTVEQILTILGINFVFESFGSNMAKVVVDGKHIGGIGIINMQRSSLDLAISFAEINLDLLPQLSTPSIYSGLKPNDFQIRDLSIVVSNNVRWIDIESGLKKISPLIESIELFDVYSTKGSLAFHITFRSPARTLKSEEVEEIVKQAVNLLQNKFGATVRS